MVAKSYVSTNWKTLVSSRPPATSSPALPRNAEIVTANATSMPTNAASAVSAAKDADGCVITSVLTKQVALDCEFVGVGKGGHDHQLARATVVNYTGAVIYDRYVEVPKGVEITDMRTQIHGITSWHLTHQRPGLTTYEQCQRDLQKLLANRLLVGHSLSSDLTVLNMHHPKHLIRDTATYQPFMISISSTPPITYRKPSLAHLYKQQCRNELLHAAGTVHDSVSDAKAVMKVYQTVEAQWEKQIKAEQRLADSSKKAVQLKQQLKKRRILQQQSQDSLARIPASKKQRAGHG